MHPRFPGIFAVAFLVVAATVPCAADDTVQHAWPSDAVYQYSVPVPDSSEMRAYL